MYNNTITRLAADNSINGKKAIIQQTHDWGEDFFFEAMTWALSPYHTFGVKQVPESTASGNGIKFTDFKLLALKLMSRELTGHAARDAIHELMERCNQDEWNGFYRLVLMKDLKCRTGASIVNAVLKKTGRPLIPVFECQLATDSAKHQKKMSGEKQVEVKLDGVRVITFLYPDGKVEHFTRNGEVIDNIPHITEELSSAKLPSGHTSVVLDGEITGSSFQHVMKQLRRKENADTAGFILNVFDFIPLNDFKAGVCQVPQKERTASLEIFLLKANLKNVVGLDNVIVDLDANEGRAMLDKCFQRAVDEGYEGIMVKDVNAPYECKRTTTWLKMKPNIEVTVEIKAVAEGTGEMVGTLGAFHCEGTDDGRQIAVSVGSGFSEQDRDDYWSRRKELIGELIEVRADAITQNQDGGYSLRFPRFKGFRGVKSGGKKS